MYPPATKFPSTPGEHVVCIPFKWDEPAAGAGDIGAHSLPGLLPAGAIIIGGFVRPVTIMASAANTATVKFSVQSVDLIAASLPAVLDPTAKSVALTNVDEQTTGEVLLLTADRQVVATVAVQNLTGGEAHLYLRYVMAQTFDYTQSEATPFT